VSFSHTITTSRMVFLWRGRPVVNPVTQQVGHNATAALFRNVINGWSRLSRRYVAECGGRNVAWFHWDQYLLTTCSVPTNIQRGYFTLKSHPHSHFKNPESTATRIRKTTDRNVTIGDYKKILHVTKHSPIWHTAEFNLGCLHPVARVISYDIGFLIRLRNFNINTIM
jgi:hypothetical protein